MVTASRLEEKVSQSPQLAKVITTDEVIDNGFRTVPESFALTPGVSV